MKKLIISSILLAGVFFFLGCSADKNDEDLYTHSSFFEALGTSFEVKGEFIRVGEEEEKFKVGTSGTGKTNVSISSVYLEEDGWLKVIAYAEDDLSKGLEVHIYLPPSSSIKKEQGENIQEVLVMAHNFFYDYSDFNNPKYKEESGQLYRFPIFPTPSPFLNKGPLSSEEGEISTNLTFSNNNNGSSIHMNLVNQKGQKEENPSQTKPLGKKRDTFSHQTSGTHIGFSLQNARIRNTPESVKIDRAEID